MHSGTSFSDGTQVGQNEARGNEDNVFGRSCIHSSSMVYKYTKRCDPMNVGTYQRYRRWCGKSKARHGK